jgi:hypothetical protein
VLIVGNLDVEVTWARMDAAARRAQGETAPSPDDPRFALPEPVMRKISAAATLLRVFARSEEDRIWTPRPVDASRMADVAALPRPRLVSGERPAEADLWWGRPGPEAMRWNDRAAVLRFRTGERGLVVRNVDDLERNASELESWVAKAPFSAAGRLRVRGGVGTRDAARAAAGLFRMYGRLVLEPWFERADDFGLVGVVEDGRCLLREPHRLHVDGRGRFIGIGVPATGLAARDRDDLSERARSIGEALSRDSFRGPFGIDAYRVAGKDSRLVLSEINARMTFGWVAHHLARACRASLGLGEDAPATLRFGEGSPPPDTIPLLLPGEDDPTCAWLETPSRHAS